VSGKLLVFGRNGQVARAIAAACAGVEIDFAGRETIDLAAPAPDIAGLIAQLGPDAVINAAGFTAVDLAETEPTANARLNRDAPIAMGRACAAADIPFVHVSSDYVFDGEKGAPYLEDDARGPLNAYGRAKAEAEAGLELLLAAGARMAVIRSSWIFSATGGNFLKTMLRLGRERGEVAVVADQWGCPTPASACAAAALELTRRMLDRDPAARGILHAAGGEAMSWADFAEAIFAAARARGGPDARVRRIGSSEFQAAAVRPRDTRLCSARLPSISEWRPTPLAEALADCLSQMERA